MEPNEIAARMSPVAQVALLRVYINAGVWRALPGAVKKKLRHENLVVQNRHDEWELTELGHQVRKYLTGKPAKPATPAQPETTYGPTFKKENTND